MSVNTQKELVQFLKKHLVQESKFYNLKADELFLDALTERWGSEENMMESHRIALLKSIHSKNIEELNVLDMAAGCGSYVLQSLKQGFNTYGVEPESWKHELIDMKFDVYDLDPAWRSQIRNGVGEHLPFEKAFFDVVDSWQTFEHVNDVDKCFSEIYRVLNSNGIAIVRAPSYMTFYEGHYKLPWLPMMPASLAKVYLKLLKRPLEGLQTFSNICFESLRRSAQSVGFSVINLNKLMYVNHLSKKFRMKKTKFIVPVFEMIYYTKNVLLNFKNVFRTERYIHILLVKKGADPGILKDSHKRPYL
ncbi:MAG: methyltransferase domain-containing protein [Fulvivirga sp.]